MPSNKLGANQEETFLEVGAEADNCYSPRLSIAFHKGPAGTVLSPDAQSIQRNLAQKPHDRNSKNLFAFYQLSVFYFW